MYRWSAGLLAVTTAIWLVALISRRHSSSTDPGHTLSALSQTYIQVHGEAALAVPPLTASDGTTFEAKRLQGHWSVIFFGFTACPLVCPKTLSLLSALAHNRESGIASGNTLPIFVSVDPAHDTPQRVGSYLSHFDGHIVGLTGSSDDIGSFAREVGAGYQPSGALIDHSTSLFVVDPKGRLAGILLRPSKPVKIIADLAKLRLAYAAGDSH